MYRESSENDGLKRHRACDEVEGQKGTLKGKRGGRVCLELRGHKRERTQAIEPKVCEKIQGTSWVD